MGAKTSAARQEKSLHCAAVRGGATAQVFAGRDELDPDSIGSSYYGGGFRVLLSPHSSS
jgi:hypothetical protein